MLPALLTASLLLPADPGHAARHPAGAAAYLELPDLATLREAWSTTALGRLLGDEELRGQISTVAEVDLTDLETRIDTALGLTYGQVRLRQILLDELRSASVSVHATADDVRESFGTMTEIQATLERMGEIRVRLTEYRRVNGALPAVLAALDPLFEEEFVDAWSNPFVYTVAEDGSSYELVSLGADGAPGGTGPDRDLGPDGGGEVGEDLFLDDFAVLAYLEFADEEGARALHDLLVTYVEGMAMPDAEPAGDEGEGITVELVPIHSRLHVGIDGNMVRVRIGDPARVPFEPEDDLTANLEASQETLPERSGLLVARGYSFLAEGGIEFARAAGVQLDLSSLAYSVDALEAVLGPWISAIVRGGHWRLGIEDGRWITDGFVPAGQELEDRFGTDPLAARRLGRLHPEAVLAWIAGLPPTWVDDALGQAFGSSLQETLAMVQARSGLRLDQELRENLGTVVAVSIPPMRSIMSLPAVFAEVDVRDGERLRAVVEALAAMWREQGVGDCKESEYRGVPMFTFGPEEEEGGSSPSFVPDFTRVSVTFVVFPDHLLLTTSAGMAKREVRRRLVLDETSELPELLQGVEVPAEAVELSVADWALFLGRLYDTLRGVGPMLGQMTGTELPFDPTLLPESTVFTRYFAPTVRHEQRRADGRAFHESSSFGPEPGLLLLVGGFWQSTRMGMVPGGRR